VRNWAVTIFMDAAFPDAAIEFEFAEASILEPVDVKDRHVVAAALPIPVLSDASLFTTSGGWAVPPALFPVHRDRLRARAHESIVGDARRRGAGRIRA
jgi:hypothetical protein